MDSLDITLISIITLLALLTIRFELYIKYQNKLLDKRIELYKYQLEAYIDCINRIRALEDKLGEK